MIPHGHMAEAAVAVVVAVVAGAGTGVLLSQAGSPAAALQAASAMASSVPDSIWISAIVLVTVRVFIAGQIKKLMELNPQKTTDDAIGCVSALVTKYHLVILDELKELRKVDAATNDRVDDLETANKLSAGIGAALKAAKGNT